MNTGRNRLGRKDHPRSGRTASGRSSWRTRGTALALAATAIASVAAPAQALTGGAATPDSIGASTGSGLSFSPTKSALATWYGPGFYGGRTACGQVLQPQTIGVAHRRLPCGTPVRFDYHGQRVVARVIDRGPFAPGRTWDLTNGARRALGFEGSGTVRYAVALTGRNR
jgi:rare lipoprotein A (peptidoglycan hydrolase)